MTIYEKNGKYYCRFQIDGERHHYLCQGAKNTKDARKIEDGFRYRLQQQLNGLLPKENNKNVTMKQLVNYFLDYSRLNKKSYIQDKYRSDVILEYFKPTRKISTIKANDIESFKAYLVNGNRGKTTANRYLENLSKMFNMAVENEWLDKNPIKKGTMFINKNYTIRYLTEDEEKRLYANLTGVLKDMVTVALQTGLRRSNIIYLKWDNINFDFRMIEILENKGNKHIKLYMNDVLFDLFKKLEQNKTSDYVFVNPKTNQPYIDFRKAWNIAKKKEGIENFRFHDLRHTVGTRLAQANVPIPIIKEVLTHSSISTTMRYVHNNSKDVKNAMNILCA